MKLKRDEVEEVPMYFWECPKCHSQNDEENEPEAGNFLKCWQCDEDVELID